MAVIAAMIPMARRTGMNRRCAATASAAADPSASVQRVDLVKDVVKVVAESCHGVGAKAQA